MVNLRPRIVAALVIVAALPLLASPARAQDSSGTIAGTVADEQGEVMPGATVTLIHEGTLAAPRTVTTDALGERSR